MLPERIDRENNFGLRELNERVDTREKDQMEGLIAGELESCLARGNPSQGFFRTGERFLVTTSYVFPCLLAYTIASDTVPRRRTRARVGDSICILYSSLLGRSPVFISCLLFSNYSVMARNSQSAVGEYTAILFTFVSSIIISDYIGVFFPTEGHSKQRHRDVA